MTFPNSLFINCSTISLSITGLSPKVVCARTELLVAKLTVFSASQFSMIPVMMPAAKASPVPIRSYKVIRYFGLSYKVLSVYRKPERYSVPSLTVRLLPAKYFILLS